MKACIFDLDGTLANTLESMSVSANQVIEPFGYAPLPAENFKSVSYTHLTLPTICSV